MRDPRPELSTEELIRVRDSVAAIGRLSDGLFRLGPFRLGIEGVLAWAPGIGELYSAGAAAYIIAQGLRARVPFQTLAVCGAMMGSRTVISAVPLAGPLAADLFLAHRISARMVVKAIDAKLPVTERSPPKASFVDRLLKPRGPVAA